MAITRTNLTSNSATGSITSQNTASITPAPDTLILLSVTTRTNITQEPNTPTITGNGLTWEEVNSIFWDTSGTSQRKTIIYRSMGSSPTTGAITIDFAGQTQTDVVWSVEQLSGVDLSGTNGSGAVVQSATNKDETGSATSITATLSAFSSANNATWGTFTTDGNDTFTQGTGFTLINQVASGTVLKQATEFRSDNDTTVDISIAVGGGLGAIGIEIKAYQPTTITGLSSVTGVSTMVI